MDLELPDRAKPACNASQLCPDACRILLEPVFRDVLLPLPWDYVHERDSCVRASELESEPRGLDTGLGEIHRDHYPLGKRSQIGVDGKDRYLADTDEAKRGLAAEESCGSPVVAKTNQHHARVRFFRPSGDRSCRIPGARFDSPGFVSKSIALRSCFSLRFMVKALLMGCSD